VTIELARRLLHGGVIATEALEAALLDAVVRGVPFPEALAQHSSGGADLIDRELERVTEPGLGTIFVDLDLMAVLPRGLCERLLAVPLGRDPTTDEVTVAAVDSLDPHIIEEFAYHLEAPVIVLPASRAVIAAALRNPSAAPESSPTTVAYEQHDTRPGVPVLEPSDAAIPGRIRTASPSQPPAESERPIPLVRRPAVTPHRPRARDEGRDAPPPPPAPPPIESTLEALDWAGKPEEVVDQLVEGLEFFAFQVAVFVEQAGTHRGRAASASLGGADAARAVAQPGSVGCVLDRAVTEGRYLGPLTPADANAGIARFLGTPTGEVYAVPVVVSGRPTLVLLLARLQTTALATRRADELARAGGAALERIVLARKGG